MPHNDSNCSHCNGKGKCDVCGCQYISFPKEFYQSEWFKNTLEQVNDIGKRMDFSSNFDIVCKQVTELLERVGKIEDWIKDYELEWKKKRRFWEILQSKSQEEIIAKGDKILSKEINEQVEEEFKEK